jgi:hypothetical protein
VEAQIRRNCAKYSSCVLDAACLIAGANAIALKSNSQSTPPRGLKQPLNSQKSDFLREAHKGLSVTIARTAAPRMPKPNRSAAKSRLAKLDVE